MEKVYKIGRVYIMKSPNTDKVYVGSTTKTLNHRLSKHKGDYNSYKAGKKTYITSIEILSKGDAYMEELETYEDITREELEREEVLWTKT